ncbi:MULTISPECIES: nicotinate-nucleotide adenylyltransferase [Bacillus]|uniref:Probable nicotinate-nucleotide adenylyltransferase n=1 Tax=Bacillus cereus TaxID=1396 RepID=A0A2A8IXF3_BACCE|nr:MULTISPECIES: nicotinate-nucleotide adenylyltransferase [Bacillus]MDH4420515.1 nicotinate-nucleotide adenylyltransferase [Bacillus cereus]PER24394.1 nicotinate-nucleotide adenylyltransferase [Bacillus cereus]PFA64735.1 nicotinate-nucleotide adenylyltransferase [Bacillus sp. AFS015896]PGL86367.1 nicotinate-nucleotide adenylyltransferase [Bacillus sp. AFS054943]PGU05915.1 nicotinate-nucleotide adenylyltransferase [Bacillus cereus]
MRKIGIIGGTFDPPHYGHLLIANEVYHALNLEEVWFLPNQIPPHKQGRNITSVESRLHMLELATEVETHFSICLEELNRKGPSYTYDTMLQLTKKYPDVQFHFIIGGDMVEYLPKWYNIEALLDLVTFVGVARPGYTLHTPYNITTVEIPEFAVSSSLLRERYKEKKTCKYLLPEKVQVYIERNGLYES